MEQELTVKIVLQNLASIFFASTLLLFLSLAYFTLILWLVKSSSYLLDLNADSNFLILSSAIITAATLLGGKKK